jgi:cell division protein FtsW
MSGTSVQLEDRRRAALERAASRDRHPASRGRSDPSPRTPTVHFYVIGLTISMLLLLGVVMVLSASSITSFHGGHSPWRFFAKQTMFAGVGLLGLFAALRIDYQYWRRWSDALLVAACASMLLPFVPGLGRSVNGARAWIGFGSISFQPSEFVKLALIVWCAARLSRPGSDMHDLRKTFRPSLVVLVAAAALAMAQSDLGAAIVMGLVVLSVLYFAGAPLGPLIGTAGIGVILGGAVVALDARRLRRWTSFLDLEANKEDAGYQVYQSILSIANGGATGAGVGQGTGKWGYVPLAHSDFIFAIIAEELGLIGVVAVIGAFGVLAFLGIQVAFTARDRFAMLVASGITAWFVVQAIINIGGVTGVMPVTGLTLPLISYGGSSLLVSMVAAGLLLNIARNVR